MNHRSRPLVITAAIVLFATGGATSAEAHNWGCWKQPNRTVPAYVTAALSSQANAAVSEWDTKTILSVPRVGSHTEMSVFDGYYGNTGWAGLASIESSSGCNILHGHARVNRSYSYTSNGYRGIFCQEVGHLFGLDHSNDGGCMGGGYYYNINTYYTVVQHNIDDIYNKYIGSPASAVPAGELAAVSPAPDTGPLAGGVPEGTARAVAFWHDRPNTLEEAVERSVAVIRGRVLRVKAGPDLTVSVEGLEDNVDRIPTQRILVAVDRVLAGQLRPRMVELFRTGNDEFVLAEDPPYVEGEQYVLFLTRADHGTYRPIAPEGRLKVTEAGLEPSSSREFMSELRGRGVEMLASDLVRVAPIPDGTPTFGTGLQLRQNAANPFTSETSVSYALPEPSDVKLGVFDAQGRLVRGLVDTRQDGPRWYTVQWDGRDDRHQPAPNGMYFIRLVTPQEVKSVSVVRIN